LLEHKTKQTRFCSNSRSSSGSEEEHCPCSYKTAHPRLLASHRRRRP
jgi:hypothetical protein